MRIRKMDGGRIACIVIAVVVMAALAFLVYTPLGFSQQAEQGAQPAQGAVGAPGAQAARGGRGGGGGFSHAAAADYNDNTGFTSLFNGTDLNGWTSDGQNWSVKDGAIYAESTCEKPTGTIYIYSDIGLAGDFDLKVRMKGTETVNSGIQYRSWLTEDLDAPHFPRPSFPGRGAAGAQGRGGAAGARGRGGFAGRGPAGACPGGQPRGTPPDRAMEAKYGMGGPQYDFDNSDMYPGQFYEQASGRGIIAWPGEVVITNPGVPKQLLGTLADKATLTSWFHKDDWNEEEVIAEGHTYLHFLNGHLVCVLVDNDPLYFQKTGHIGFEIESTGQLYIKDVYLKKFSD
ncbi:MAG: 3-keto-disaccharide hydrolase [Candidatus Acidiferrales bacterium]